MNAHSERKVPIEQLLTAIEDALRAGPHLAEQLANDFGFSTCAVRRRLEQLEREHRAHRVRVHGHGLCYLWHSGALPGAVIAPPIALGRELPRANLRVLVPFQSVVRTWPAFGGRDPLVTALFGPGRQVGA